MTYRIEQRVPLNHPSDAPRWVVFVQISDIDSAVLYARDQRRVYQNAGIDGEFRVVEGYNHRVIRHFTSSSNPAQVPELGIPTGERSTA